MESVYLLVPFNIYFRVTVAGPVRISANSESARATLTSHGMEGTAEEDGPVARPF
jgi:hypothetical protein